MTDYTELKVDLEREAENIKYGPQTGIYVRATKNDKWGSYDIADLEKESLLAWLKSNGGDNSTAENVVGILLGHGNF